jgi:hypothetical protein
LAQSLSNLFQQNVIKYPNIGINAGFQGLDLKIFDEYDVIL